MKRPDRYAGVVVRDLRADERRVPTEEAEMPVVVEPAGARDAEFLEEFLARHSEPILENVTTRGAVLLRGFEVGSVADFERVVLSIRGMQGMNEVLMSELGRTVVPGTRFVLYTNTRFKTGGTLETPIFHHENYYVPDVPRFISFLCLRPPWLGGETGLLNSAKLYADLPSALREKLESHRFAVSDYRLAHVAARYGLPVAEVRAFCERAGLSTATRDGREYLVIHKPSVVQHPATGERALQINISGQLDRVGLAGRIAAAFAADYTGPRWLVHRFHWRFPLLLRWSGLLAGLFVRPRQAWPMLAVTVGGLFRRRRPGAAGRTSNGAHRVADLFSESEVDLLARSMRRRYSSFLWKRGDVLIVDNLKVAHAGMPGFGPRNLKALICNCLSVPYAADGPGLHASRPDEVRECLGAQLLRHGTSLDRGLP